MLGPWGARVSYLPCIIAKNPSLKFDSTSIPSHSVLIVPTAIYTHINLLSPSDPISRYLLRELLM